MSVARLSAALVVRFDAAAGTLDDVRVSLGAVGGAAFRASSLEASLAGRPADEATAQLFAEGCVAAVQGSIARPLLAAVQAARGRGAGI